MQKLLLILLFVYAPVKAQKTAIEVSGDILQIGLPVIALGSTYFIQKDDKPHWQFIKSFGTAIITEQALKHIIDKKRPNGGNYAFPSGHTTAAFNAATFIQIRYGWRYGIPALTLASYVGYSRIYARKHDIWDVMAGASLGIGTAFIFVKTLKNKNLSIRLSKSNSYYRVGIVYNF